MDQEIIDEFLIPDRQELYQLDYSDIQFDSIPSSPSFYSFIDDIIGEVREEIHIEKVRMKNSPRWIDVDVLTSDL